jgi:cleavage stimulation factor subunit 3
MTARSALVSLNNITRGLNRTTMPQLPPAKGFAGEQEYLQQVELWKRWIEWEKEDPIGLKDEDPAVYKERILYVFKQAFMALRFWPEIWFEASEYCFQNGMEKEGMDYLTDGIEANPESVLLAFKLADRLESTLPVEESDEGLKRRGEAVRAPYDKVLDTLYDFIKNEKTREDQDVSRIEQLYPALAPRDEDDDEQEDPEEKADQATKAMLIQKRKAEGIARTKELGKTISFVWIAVMRAMRRIQGKGKVGSDLGGSRQIFTDARKRGRLTSDVYVASALIEYHCYKDPAATKIFERGMKLFPEDEQFALEYLKHLIAINDITSESY